MNFWWLIFMFHRGFAFFCSPSDKNQPGSRLSLVGTGDLDSFTPLFWRVQSYS